MTIDLVPRRMGKRAAGAMAREHERGREIGQAELADVQDGKVRILLWIRAEVPRIYFIFAHLQPIQILDSGNLGNGLGHGPRGPQFLYFLLFAESSYGQRFLRRRHVYIHCKGFLCFHNRVAVCVCFSICIVI